MLSDLQVNLFLVTCQEHLSLTHNNLRILHGDVTELPNLRMLNCRDNKLSNNGLPENLFTLDDLSVLVCVHK